MRTAAAAPGPGPTTVTGASGRVATGDDGEQRGLTPRLLRALAGDFLLPEAIEDARARGRAGRLRLRRRAPRRHVVAHARHELAPKLAQVDLGVARLRRRRRRRHRLLRAGFGAGAGAGAGGSGSGAHGVGCTDWAARGTGMRDAEAGERSGGAAGAAATAAGAAAVAAARSALRMSSAVRVAAGAAAVVTETAAGEGGGAEESRACRRGRDRLGGGLLPSGSAAGAWPHQLGYRSSMPPGCWPRTTRRAPPVCPG